TLLTFIPAAGDFINAALLGSPKTHMIGNVIQSKFLELTDYPAAAAMSFVLMAAILVMGGVYARAGGTEKLTGRAPPPPPILAVRHPLLPIGVVSAFSFNQPKGRFNYIWSSFTFDNWIHWDAVPGIRSALILSLEIALLASIAAPALGPLIALVLVRYQCRGRGSTNLLVFLPLSTPEIVLGASLLTLFLNLNTVLGFWTILIAHVMFCICFAVVTVKARLIGFDRHLEEAAMDLGANEWVTFRRVTLPLMAPALLASLLLCFGISVAVC